MKFIDFFSGIGGFRLGMEMAGNECVGHCEIDKFADKSYRAMHDVKEGEWYANDIRAVEPRDLPEADCYCGGFPCQAFSVAGKRGGFEDTRGTLFFEVMRLATVRKPKYLFMENVAGLLSHDGGKTFGTILNTLGQLGYWYEYQVLNSKNYGVPQNRERVFIIGHLGGYSGGEIFPITGSDSETLKQLVRGSQGNRVYDTGGVSCTLASQAGGKGAKTGLYLINKNHNEITFRDDFNCLDANYYKGLDSHQARTGVLEVRPVLTLDRSEKRQNGRRMKEPGEEIFTLTAQDKHGVMLRPVRTEYGKEIRKQYEAGEVEESRHNMTKLEPRNDDIANTLTSVQKDNLLLQQTRIRRLTPKECFRLQGFPDEYFNRAAAVNSDSQLYKQAGNSVTVNVIYEIARRLT
jgi:DNA (cytosine-5)-methyltransferase 1